MSIILDIPLVIYGENEAEYGNAIHENENPKRDPNITAWNGQLRI